jgi:cytochrome c553
VRYLLTVVFILASMASSVAYSADIDIDAGKAKYAMCAACHGSNGISAIPQYPNLAGQKAAYTAQELRAFKSGTRKGTVMNPFAAMLGEEDMVNLAAYIETLGCK